MSGRMTDASPKGSYDGPLATYRYWVQIAGRDEEQMIVSEVVVDSQYEGLEFVRTNQGLIGGVVAMFERLHLGMLWCVDANDVLTLAHPDPDAADAIWPDAADADGLNPHPDEIERLCALALGQHLEAVLSKPALQ